jgi:hypothetical protein
VFARISALILIPSLLLGPPGSTVDTASSDSPEPEPVSEPEVSEPAPPTECVPACREGYLCHSGSCISACNPPCDQDQQCTADGQCVGVSSPEVATVAVIDNACGTGCPHPYVCQQGDCRITDSYLEGLEREGKSRVKGGVITMAVGGALAGVGLIVGGIALAQHNRWFNRSEELANTPNCSGTPSCFEERDAALFKSHDWDPVRWSFLTGIAPLGAIILIAGGIAFGVGKKKLARSKEFRGKPVAWMSPQGAGGGLTLEF